MNISFYHIKLIILILFIGCKITNAQIGSLSFTNDFEFASTTSYFAEIKDVSGSGLGNDLIIVGNDLTLNGTLDLSLLNYDLDPVDIFELLTYGGELFGTFSNINWPQEMLDQGWLIDYGLRYPGSISIFGPLHTTTLPVDLLSFTVSSKNDSNILRWTTSTELNNDYFLIEHKNVTGDFVEIDKVKGHKTNSSVHQYEYAHQTNLSGLHYYRLKQVDYDGNFEYSDILSIRTTESDEVDFYPNPSNGNINFHKSVSGLEIYDLTGKKVLNISEASSSYDLSALAVGMYYLKLKNTNTYFKTLFITK